MYKFTQGYSRVAFEEDEKVTEIKFHFAKGGQWGKKADISTMHVHIPIKYVCHKEHLFWKLTCTKKWYLIWMGCFFSSDEAKKESFLWTNRFKMAASKKNSFSSSANSQYFFMKI